MIKVAKNMKTKTILRQKSLKIIFGWMFSAVIVICRVCGGWLLHKLYKLKIIKRRTLLGCQYDVI
jgi:hypothetical protein